MPDGSGVYGGSYGGFLTRWRCSRPGRVAAGAALRPDRLGPLQPCLHSNIWNLPQRDAEAYRKSSPIYCADGLKARC